MLTSSLTIHPGTLKTQGRVLNGSETPCHHCGKNQQTRPKNTRGPRIALETVPDHKHNVHLVQ